MKRIFTLLFIAISIQLNAQNESNNWHFGINSGLNFDTNIPTIIGDNNAMNMLEGCSGISDPVTGQFLFYTNGEVVKDKLFQSMQGTVTNVLKGGVSSTQSSMIVPKPGSSHIYYIFTTPAIEDWCSSYINPNPTKSAFMQYIQVDMLMNNGNGMLVGDNIPIMDSSTEKLCGYKTCEGNFWIVGHKFDSDTFYAFKLTANGLSAPVKSKVGSMHSSGYNDGGTGARGYMKFSPDGSKIGLLIQHPSTIEILNFDQNTGVISNPITLINSNDLGLGSQSFACSFSPDNTKFYANDISQDVYQYDLNAGLPQAIWSSKTYVGAALCLQIAKNGKMYCYKATSMMDVINNPNLPGAACDYQIAAQSCGIGGSAGLPNLPENLFLGENTTPFLVPANLNVCMGDTLFAPQSASDYTIISNGNWSNIANHYKFFPDTTTTYMVIKPATQCNPADTIRFTVNVRNRPAVDFTYSINEGCKGDTIQFQNLTDSANNYLWNFGDGYSSTAKNTIHLYIAPGTYFVKLMATNSYGCSDSVFKSVTIAPFLRAAFTTSDTIVCQGGTITFRNESTNINNASTAYYWYFGDGINSFLQNPSHTYATADTYKVMLVAANAVPCYDTSYAKIIVDSIPGIMFSLQDTAICLGDAISFTTNYNLSGLNYIQWNFGETMDWITDNNIVEHAYDKPGIYTITMQGNYRRCPNPQTSRAVTVKPMPYINLGPDTSICFDAVSFSISDKTNSSNSNANWLWSNGATTPTISVKHDGVFSATVTIDQCSTTDQIIIKKDCYIDIPNAFTPNNDGVDDYFFPVKLLSSELTGFSMTIYNRWGQTVFETTNPSGRGWDGRLNGKDQEQGVYIYSIKAILKNGKMEHYTGNLTLLK